MSLRPDDRKGRSRSKSPGGRRERSRSNIRAPSPGPSAQYYSSPAGAYPTEAGATPQYEVRQPSQQSYGPPTPGSEGITMGGYTDLPPHERPGYMQQAQAAQQYLYHATDRGPASSTVPGVQYAQPLQYAQAGAQYSYNPGPVSQSGPTRQAQSNGAGFQYANPTNITFTAKPVTGQQQHPITYTAQPAGQPSQQQQAAQQAAHYQQHPLTYTAQPAGQPNQQQQAAQQAAHYQQQQQQQQQYFSQAPQASQAPPAPQAPQTPQDYQAPHPPAQHYPPPPPGPPSPPQQQQKLHPEQPKHGRSRSQSHSGYDSRNVVEIVPGGAKPKPPPSPGLRPHSLSVHGQRPDGLNQRMDRLSVSGNRPDIQTIVPGGMLPPPSPMLEAYHGTYQSLSPMPSPVLLHNDDIDHIPSLDSLSPHASSNALVPSGHRRAHSRNPSSSSRHSPSPSPGHRRVHSSSRHSPSPDRRTRPQDRLALEAAGRSGGRRDRERERERRVKIYDATEDATALVNALSASRTVDVDTLIDILPALSHDQMLELRAEYKRHCKVQGRGINIAKHIKLKTSGNFGKIAYVTALGRYESEGYWANYWYQSNSARRELLIEALMGRQNYEIREIKDAFKDKRYSDSLTKCMEKELKVDKFRKAILMALEGERQEESDVWPIEYRNRDVDSLYKALNAREGGETAMLSVVVRRSDAHLREVLRTYERKYGGNFAREALRKSNNLVGEVIAHILNGVINRPARDSMLLHHALMDLIDPEPPKPSSKDYAKPSSSARHERQQRHELLISRLTRLHWDRMHLMKVKREYEEKYGRVIEEDIEDATKGDFREFCIELCQMGR